jgi:hypothetical protein
MTVAQDVTPEMDPNLSPHFDLGPFGAIVGDWFVCQDPQDPQCASLTHNGFRHTWDGWYIPLFAAPPTLEPKESYCYVAREILKSTFTWDGQDVTLVHKLNGETITVPFTINGDIATVSGGTMKLRKIIPRAAGTCVDRDPWVCPKSVGSFFSDKCRCDWTWHCDNDSVRLECKKNSATSEFQCNCHKAGKTDTFTAPLVCDSVTLTQGPTAAANKGCNWKIWEPYK